MDTRLVSAKTRSVATVIVLAALALGPAAAPASARVRTPRSCHPKGSLTLAQSASAAVWIDTDSRDAIGPNTHFWLCEKRRRRNHLLRWVDVGEHGGGLGLISFSRSYAAIENIPQSDGSQGSEIRVVQIRSAKTRLRIQTTNLSSLVVKNDASVAWINGNSGLEDTQGRPIPPQVLVHDASGQHVIDQGPGIGLKSLRLTGSTLHWTHSGTAKTATLR